jgi:hypothetical protein
MAERDEVKAAQVELHRATNALRALERELALPDSLPRDGPAEPPFCRFCGSGSNHVHHMIAGTTAHICETCVLLCYSIVRRL